MDRPPYDKKLGPLVYLFSVSACSSDSTSRIFSRINLPVLRLNLLQLQKRLMSTNDFQHMKSTTVTIKAKLMAKMALGEGLEAEIHPKVAQELCGGVAKVGKL